MKILFLIILSLLSLPGFGQEDDELIRELEADRKKQTEFAVELDKSKIKIQEAVFNAPEELRKIGHETVTAASLMDEKVVIILKEMMKRNPLQNKSQDEVRELILLQSRGKPFESFLSDNPRALNAAADIVRDEKALPSLIGILLKRDTLKIYFFIWLSILITAWLIKKYWIKSNKKWSKTRIFFGSLLVSLLGMTLSISIFYNLFYEELSPTVQIIHYHIQAD